jgi:hypothetical protein
VARIIAIAAGLARVSIKTALADLGEAREKVEGSASAEDGSPKGCP